MGLAPGETFGRYTIEASIGAGGMGLVLRAHDNILDRQVALKIIRPDGQEKEEACARFFREARLAARLTHPNTIRIYDLGEIEETPFIAMEHIDGSPLTVFAGQRDVPLERRIGWMLGIARGLEAAHAIGLVHRDVKLSNMMVSTDDVAKILDFGLAKRRETSPRLRATFHTDIGFVVGTPMYMAPEQLDGAQADARSDQFSWGLAAYLLLSGRNPRAIDPLLLTPITPLDAIVPGMPPRVAAVVARTLQKQREHRFEDMTRLIAALDEALRTRVVAGPPSAPIQRTRGRPFYCPGCATQLDENRRCPRCGFVAKKVEPEAKPPAPPEPPKVIAWKLVRSEDRAPFAPAVAAIGRDGVRAIVFGDDGAARRDGSPSAWARFTLRANVSVRCASYDFDGSVILGGKNGFAGRLMLDGAFMQWPLVTSKTLVACTTSATGRVTFVGNGIVAHVKGSEATAFSCEPSLTAVARLGDVVYACGEGALYSVGQTSIERVTPIEIGDVKTMIAAKDSLFLAGSPGFVWRMESDGRLAKEPIDDKDVAFTLLAASSTGIFAVTDTGRLYRRDDARWARFAGLEEEAPLVTLRMLGDQLVGIAPDGAVVTSELKEKPVARTTQPLPFKQGEAKPAWRIERLRESTTLAPFRLAAISPDGRTFAAVSATTLAAWKGAWTRVETPNVDLPGIRALAFDTRGNIIIAGARGFATRLDGSPRFIVGHSRASTTTFVAIACLPEAVFLGGVAEGGAGLFVRANNDGSTSAIGIGSPIVSMAISASGRVYIACADGFVGHVDETDARLAVKLGTRIRQLVAAGDDLFAIGHDGDIHFIGQDGRARHEPSEAEGPIVAVASRSGVVFAATARGHVVRRDPSEATPLWRRLSPIDTAPYAILALHAEERGFLALADDGSRTTGTP